MSNTPLPEPDYTQVTPPRFYKDERTIQHWWGAEAMHAHAAAVLAAERITAAHWQSLAEANMALAVSANKRMAAKDAEIAGLRADNTRLQNEVVMPLRERVKVLEAMLTEAESALRVAEQEFADMPTWSNVGHAAKKVAHALAVIAALGIGGGGK